MQSNLLTPPVAYVGQPKYLQWAQELRRQIQSGALQPGDRLPSHTEMRRHHGVSQPTMERIHAVLEQEGLIVREPGRGVFVANREPRPQKGVLGCMSFALAHARHLSRHNLYWSHLFDGLMEGALEAGRQVLVFNHFSHRDAWEKIDGAIITGEGNLHEVLPGMPTVSLMRPLPGVTTVRPDIVAGTGEAVEYLLQLGHTRIGCLMFTDDPTSMARVARCREVLNAAGIEFRPQWLRSLTAPGESNFDFVRYGKERVAAWLQQDWSELGLTALLCENDQAAMGAMAALREAGLRVPEDVSLVGCDGTEISRHSHPTLTTIEVPLQEIGRRGAQELLLRIEDDTTPIREIMLPTRLQVRASTAPLGHRALEKNMYMEEK